MFHTIEEALEDLKAGKPIIVVDDENRENEGDIVVLADHATPENINFMAKYARGLICTPISKNLASQLNLHPMVANNTDNHQTAFTVSIDHIDTSTGISAFERSHTILQLLNPQIAANDFRRPGHIFPLIAKDNGVLERRGHTEAAVDLAMLCGASKVGVICEIMGEDGTMSTGDELTQFAETHQLKVITIEALVQYRFEKETVVTREATAQLPTEFGDFQLIGYSNSIDADEHLALVKGDILSQDAPLVRVHSSCITGDIFHSKRCDCGTQLHNSMELIENKGSGIILYMQQEGRGIGLINKLRAYELQEKGYDTVQANEILGFLPDERNYALSAQMLRDLGIKKVRLLTNNPDKVTGLETYGIEVVERIAIEVAPVKENAFYLQTKKDKMNHILH